MNNTEEVKVKDHYSLKDFQALGRLNRGKFMHNYGIAMDMALFPKDYKSWRIPDPRIIPLDLSCSDRIMSHIMMLQAMRIAMNSTLGIPKERLGKPNINRIQDMSIIEDMLHFSKYFYRSKYKPMYKFKNSFAAYGSIINLLRFEQELLKLGYGTIADRPDVFNYRSINKEPAKYITSGCHFIAPRGTFIPASNDGGADVRFNLDIAFDEAVKYASETKLPLFVTNDGKEIYSTHEKIYGVRKLNYGETYLASNPHVYRGYYITAIYYSHQKSDLYEWFSSFEKAKEYIDLTVPLMKTEDGIDVYINSKVWCVKPDLTSYFVKKGLDEKTPWPGYKYFLIKENANKYIDENTIRFSKRQIRDAVNNSVVTKEYTIDTSYTIDISGHKIRMSAIDGGKLKQNLGL